HFVSRRMAEAVVDRLEVVEICEDEGKRLAEALCPGKLLFERGRAEAPVGETREPVDERLLLDSPMPLRVAERDDGVPDQPVGRLALIGGELFADELDRAEGLERKLEPRSTAVLCDDVLVRDEASAGGSGQLHRGLDDHSLELVDVVCGGSRLAEAKRPLRAAPVFFSQLS